MVTHPQRAPQLPQQCGHRPRHSSESPGQPRTLCPNMSSGPCVSKCRQDLVSQNVARTLCPNMSSGPCVPKCRQDLVSQNVPKTLCPKMSPRPYLCPNVSHTTALVARLWQLWSSCTCLSWLAAPVLSASYHDGLSYCWPVITHQHGSTDLKCKAAQAP